MLAHWYELFPEPQDSPRALQHLSEEDMQDCLERHPLSWTRLLRELCTAEDEDDIAEDFIWGLFSALEDAVRNADDKTWRSVWRTGFASTLAQLIDSTFLCGYTREELVAGDCGRCMERVSMMFALMLACTERMARKDRPEQREQVLDIMQDRIAGAYAKLWAIKDPFLIDELMDSERSADEPFLYETDLLFLTLVKLGYIMANELKRHRTIQPIDSCIPRIFLLAWIWSSDLLTRSDAIRYLDLISQQDTDENRESWTKFFSASAEGCCGNSEILEAIRRDLVDENVIDDTLTRSFIVLTMWQQYYTSLDETLTDDFDLGPSCLAAARRQLCRGRESQENRNYLLAGISGTFKNLFAGLPLRGRYCYAYLDLLCQFVLLRIELDGSDFPVILKTSLEYGITPLRAQLSSTRAQSVVLRAHTLREWDAVANALARRRVAQRSIHWRRFVQTWDAVRVLLTPTHGSETPAVAFGALERCAWAWCLCSRHKPAHLMRVCKGCERVAYCGKRCQQKDWKEGGHRDLCRTRDIP